MYFLDRDSTRRACSIRLLATYLINLGTSYAKFEKYLPDLSTQTIVNINYYYRNKYVFDKVYKGYSSILLLLLRIGYRCLRAVGFLSGLATGAGCIFWLQKNEITILGSPADSGTYTYIELI